MNDEREFLAFARDFFGLRKNPPSAPPPEKVPKPPPLVVYAEDDLMTRAEKIVASIGISGSGCGYYIIQAYRVLQKYEILDREKRAREIHPAHPPKDTADA